MHCGLFLNKQDATCRRTDAKILKREPSWQERMYCYNCVKVSSLCIWIYGKLWKLHTWCLPRWVKKKKKNPTDLPGSAIHIKLNHTEWFGPVTDSFTSFHGPCRETTAPINLTSKNVQKCTPHPPSSAEHHQHTHIHRHHSALLHSSHIQNHTKTNTFQNPKPIKPNKTNKAGQRGFFE